MVSVSQSVLNLTSRAFWNSTEKYYFLCYAEIQGLKFKDSVPRLLFLLRRGQQRYHHVLSKTPKQLLVVIYYNEKTQNPCLAFFKPCLSLEMGIGSWESLLPANSQLEQTNVKELCDHSFAEMGIRLKVSALMKCSAFSWITG